MSSTSLQVGGEEYYDVEDEELPDFSDFYAYRQLNDEEKKIYARMVGALKNFESAIIPETDEEELKKIFHAVLSDHPEIFYVDGLEYATRRFSIVQNNMTIKGTYLFDRDETEELQKTIDAWTEDCISGIAEDAGDFEKVRHVYEYVIENTDYVVDAENSQNIVSVMRDHQSVCSGYARALQYVLQKLGIECCVTEGEARGGSHAWNLVKMDGQYYYVDPTWGDASYQVSSGGQSTYDIINYDYLGVTTADLTKTHTIDDTIPQPECTCMDDNYYVQMDAYLTSADMDKIAWLFQRAQQQGWTRVRYRCSSEEVYRQLYTALIDNDGVYQYLQDGSDSITYICSEDLWTMTLVMDPALQ